MIKMKQTLILVFFLQLFLCIYQVFPAEKTKSKSFLWQVQSENKTNTVYILGSIHVGKIDIYPLSRSIEKAFDRAAIVVFEYNLSDSKYKLSDLLMEKAIYPKNDNLKKHISDKTLKLLEKKLDDFGLTIEQVASLKPWYLALVISNMQSNRSLLQPSFDLDNYFYVRAIDNKKILGLESIEYQLDLFNHFSDELQDQFLYFTIQDLNEHPDYAGKLMDNLTKAWLKGDTDAFADLLNKDLSRHPELAPIYDKMIYTRNNTMLAKIETYLKDKTTYFLVVGAGHLVGEKGIIEQLIAKGYLVQQI